MTKNVLFFFIIISSAIFSQSGYKAKFLFAYDFPSRHQIGIKLLGDKPLSFTLKTGYQIGLKSIGDHINDNLQYEPSCGLTGLIGSLGTEINFKSPYHKISIEYEYGILTGDFQTPNKFNVGKDYFITDYTVESKNQLILIGYNFHLKHHANFSMHFKVGGGYRQSKVHTYYKGSRMPGSNNYLKEPIDETINANIFNMRVGISYCFGHTKLIKLLDPTVKNQINLYFKNQDSIINFLFKNNQISSYADRYYKRKKKTFKKFLRKHELQKDSTKVEIRLAKLQDDIKKYLFYRLMKPGAYRREIIKRDGRKKYKHIPQDFYNSRKHEKVKELYEKNRIN
jgi:hypothetical protein